MQKFLSPAAPTPSGPPFLLAQLPVLALFVLRVIVAAIRFCN